MRNISIKPYFEYLKKHHMHIQTAFILIALFLLSVHAYADGKNLLEGTDGNLVTTLNTTGKTYIYITEGIVSIGSYIRTKNMMVFIGVVAISVFLDVVLVLAGY